MAWKPMACLVALLLAAPALSGCFGAEETPPQETVSPLDKPTAWTPGFTWFPQAPRPGDPVTFRPTAGAPNGTNATFSWNFGDGATAEGPTPRHPFASEGNFTVTLRVSTPGGNFAPATNVVVVAASNPPPEEQTPPSDLEEDPIVITDPPFPPEASVRRAVVAVVDSGVNPYHAVFQAPGRGSPAARIPGFPTGAREHALASSGAYDSRVSADKAFWDSLKVGEFVSFPHNRIVGAISMGQLGDLLNPSSSIVLDDVGHGTGTAGAVAIAGPDVDIVLVQAGAATVADGIRWAASQPWIDVISVSWGTPGNLPLELLGSDLVDATREATEAGKLVVVSAGNEPTLAWTDGNNGPAWVVAVGGVDPETHGEVSSASKGAELVSDYSPVLPSVRSVDGMEEMYGTSFSTPIVSGVAGQALTILLRVGAEPDAASLRSALHRSAVYWGPTDYSVPGYVGTSQPVPIGPAPWVQMGYGYLTAEHATIVAGALAGNAPAAKDAAATAYMDAQMAARALLWG